MTMCIAVCREATTQVLPPQPPSVTTLTLFIPGWEWFVLIIGAVLLVLLLLPRGARISQRAKVTLRGSRRDKRKSVGPSGSASARGSTRKSR